MIQTDLDLEPLQYLQSKEKLILRVYGRRVSRLSNRKKTPHQCSSFSLTRLGLRSANKANLADPRCCKGLGPSVRPIDSAAALLLTKEARTPPLSVPAHTEVMRNSLKYPNGTRSGTSSFHSNGGFRFRIFVDLDTFHELDLIDSF